MSDQYNSEVDEREEKSQKGELTDALSTQNSRTAKEYGDSYFHGLFACSAVKSWCFGGAVDGMALRPLEVMVLGRDFENKGRMVDCRR
jgi:hypothetical protein